MGLKNIEFARAEDFTPEFRAEKGLPATGTIIIETLNDNLRTAFKPMPQGGIREYLLTLGSFIDNEIPDA